MIFSACILLSVLAAFFDQPGLLFVSCSLGLFVLFRYIYFFHTILKIASSCSITRKVEKKHFHQGNQIRVVLEIKIHNPDNFQVSYTEILPPGWILAQGDLEIPICTSEEHASKLTYWFISMIHGIRGFVGGDLIISDYFFSITLRLSGKKYSYPEIKIIPVPLFEKEDKITSFIGREIDQLGLVHGQGIRSFREYIPGDEMKTIDWKMSAKYAKLFVREYTSLHFKSPLIIVDLPDIDVNENDDRFIIIVRAISGIIDKALKRGTKLSLLVISGPNIIEMLIEDHNWNNLMELVRNKFHPTSRLHHLYRVKQRSLIRKEIRDIMDISDIPDFEKEKNYYKNKVHILHKILLDSGMTRFSVQITRLLGIIHPDEVYLYSLCSGDLSHIEEIINQTRYQNIKFQLKTPLFDHPESVAQLGKIIQSEKIEGVL